MLASHTVPINENFGSSSLRGKDERNLHPCIYNVGLLSASDFG